MLESLQFEFNRRDYAPLNRMDVVDIKENMPISDVNQVIPERSLPFEKMEIGQMRVSQFIAGGGATYDSGTGFWLGDDAGTWRFFIGISTGNKLTWDGTALAIAGAISASTIDIGGADATSFHVDIDGNMWLGAATFNIATNPFAVSNSGVIRAVSGTVGGWTLSTTTLTNTAGGNTVTFSTGATAIISGPTGAPTFSVTAAGALTATSGSIGGWNLSATVLRSGATDAVSNVLIDSANSLIRLGPITGLTITIDGANQRIRSSTYSTGVAGFTVEPGLVEAQNIIARGTLSGSVFRYDVISATGGRQVIANADALSAAMTALDASTLTIRGNVTFAVNDILIIRAQTSGGIQEEYLRVTGIGAAPTYTVTRDLVGTYGADANPAWAAGTAVVQQGESDGAAAFSGGWLDLVGEASSGNWPRISVIQRTGVGATAFTERVRMGNLNGYVGYVADTYGFACGSSAGTDANITIDPTNGIRIRNGTTSVITLDNAGNVTVNTITANAGTIAAFTIAATTISATNLQLVSGAANTARITVGTGSNLAGLNSPAAGGDIAFWGGSAFADRATAPWRVTAAGAFTATTGTVLGSFNISTGGNLRSGQTAYNTGTGWFMEYNAGTPRLSIGDTTTNNSLTWDGTTLRVNGSSLVGEDKFGDGSDGDVVLGVNTTLTRDMFYDDLNINGFILSTGGYRIFVRGTLSGTGTIRNNGNNGSNGANGGGGGSAGGGGGSAPAAITVPAGEDGKTGGDGPGAGGNNPGVAGDNQTKCMNDNAGVAGGNGGNGAPAGSGGGASGAGGGATSSINNVIRNANIMYWLYDMNTAGVISRFTISPGGGSGGSGGGVAVPPVAVGGAGGGSGSSGGCVVLFARTITFTGAIQVTGGNGGNGGNGHNNDPNFGGGGGGGAGGQGGVILICTSSSSATYSTSVIGGTGGTGGASGGGGATAGSDGTIGVTGIVRTVIV